MPIYNSSRVELKAVVVSVILVNGIHAVLENRVLDYFPNILQNKVPSLNWLQGLHTIPFALREESPYVRGPFMFLNSPIHAVIPTGRRALGEHDPIQAVLTTTLEVSIFAFTELVDFWFCRNWGFRIAEVRI
jgi:hypothetical protein